MGKHFSPRTPSDYEDELVPPASMNNLHSHSFIILTTIFLLADPAIAGEIAQSLFRLAFEFKKFLISFRLWIFNCISVLLRCSRSPSCSKSRSSFSPFCSPFRSLSLFLLVFVSFGTLCNLFFGSVLAALRFGGPRLPCKRSLSILFKPNSDAGSKKFRRKSSQTRDAASLKRKRKSARKTDGRRVYRQTSNEDQSIYCVFWIINFFISAILHHHYSRADTAPGARAVSAVARQVSVGGNLAADRTLGTGAFSRLISGLTERRPTPWSRTVKQERETGPWNRAVLRWSAGILHNRCGFNGMVLLPLVTYQPEVTSLKSWSSTLGKLLVRPLAIHETTPVASRLAQREEVKKVREAFRFSGSSDSFPLVFPSKAM